MQVYRGMDVGTAKPTAQQRARAVHHLIDIIDPDEPFSVAEYRARADEALADIWARGRQPILVGGSGLYVRGVLEEMDFSAAPPDAEVRRRLTAEARGKGVRALHEWLTEVDPEAAARIHPNDEKRIVRALEVWESTGRPTSRPRKLDQGARGRYNTRQFGLTLPREELYRRVEARVDGMIAGGLVEEVQALASRGYGPELVAMKGLGYAQLAAHARGRISREEAVRRLKRDTRRFAKRQLTWFRADPRIEWVDMMEVGGVRGAAELIAERWHA
jgi:tRNA dimethylallyltransferase